MDFEKSINRMRRILHVFKPALLIRKSAEGKNQKKKPNVSERGGELKICQEHFQFALEASAAGVWEWDIRSNSVFYSRQSLEILELKGTLISIGSKRWEEIIHPNDIDKYYNAIQKHFDKKTSFYENYLRIMTGKGNYKWILNKGKAIDRDENGKPIRVIGAQMDVSEGKAEELELKNKVEAYRKQKNRLLNFSHIVTHNLNTHIGNIKMLLDINDIKENKSNVETLQTLRTVSDDLSGTLTDLSQIVKIMDNPSVMVKPLELNMHLSKVLELVNGYSHKPKAEIVNNIPKEATVHFNPAYLESVLLNLCTNAVKYAHPDRFPVIKFDFFMESHKKTLAITDNGLGIDLEKHGDSIFGMYKTFHKNRDAQGIGLYITKNQIEAMKGELSVASRVGEGTTFKIRFYQ